MHDKIWHDDECAARLIPVLSAICSSFRYMGHLLGLIVDCNRTATGLMISTLVTYLDANDAGPGFYELAQQLGDLPRGASASAKFDFWVSQVKALHRHYAPMQRT